ncbi:geranylgeranyl diphosphate synthase IdsB [Mycobacterium spongiae]|uniref:Polyprenyl synthetase family protein n=1 Tax=Mycobacterium spongiae TaxID=886343 RepID=A0A975PX89_9MYCO|nr:geranylgeranyl diphosphate synthase IdsB [Mycobacterium spongiae]QUR68006.1 polyprenyl synthetase family protein [Mycobacterium spongiae]
MTLRAVHNFSTDLGQALLRRARSDCDPFLRRAIGSIREPLATMAGYHRGWWNAHGSMSEGSSGKALRAALVLAAAGACDGDTSAATPVAAAVELVHDFTLLHDDVMDRDSTRRGRPTVWSVWGIDSAILLGDALHAAAIRALTQLRDPSVAVEAIMRLETACRDMCIGQFEDCRSEGRPDVTIDDYLRIAAGKTAALTACCCALGALSANADRATLAALEQFGYELGLAFQVVDDLIGIWGDPAVTGKPVGNDLGRRKSSLPVVAALNSRTGAAVELGALYQTTVAMTQSDIDRAAALVEVAGGRQAAQQYADTRIQNAIGALPDGVRSEDLVALAQLACRREH